MRAFEYKDIKYRSMSEFCKKFNISLQKLRRFCRHYIRPSKDPSIACDWILSDYDPASEGELKTHKYYKDREKSYERHQRFLDKAKTKIEEVFIMKEQS